MIDDSPFLTKVDGMYELDGEAFRAHVYAIHPEIVGYIPESTCCRGCKVEDIANDLGRPAAQAWEALYWYGLLDEPEGS